MVEFKNWAIIYCTLAIIPILWPAVIFGDQIGNFKGIVVVFSSESSLKEGHVRFATVLFKP